MPKVTLTNADSSMNADSLRSQQQR